MNIINADEIQEMKCKIQLLQACLSCVNHGYKIRCLENSLDKSFMIDDDYYMSTENLFRQGLDLVLDKEHYREEVATKEEGMEVGYDLYYDTDEVTVFSIKITEPHIMSYLKTLKRHNISVYDDENLYKRLYQMDFYAYDLGATECLIGANYSGVYILTTYFEFNVVDLVEGLINSIYYCADQNRKYNLGQKIAIENKGNITYIQKCKKKRKRSWSKRDIYKNKLRGMKNNDRCNSEAN